MPSRFSAESKTFSCYLFVFLSAGLFVTSWVGVGQIWPLIFFAFLPLFRIHQFRSREEISALQSLWFTFLTFFLWNVGTLYFLFNMNENIGVRLLSLCTPVMINAIWMTAVMLVFQWVLRRHGWATALFILILCWLSIEWAQHHWTLAFPWLTLGNVMASHPQWIQWYSVTGVAGGSLWVLLANAGVVVALQQDGFRAKKFMKLVLAAVIIFFPLIWNLTFSNPEGTADPVTFTIVQPCLDNESEKFEPGRMAENILRGFELVENSTNNPGIVVFPETFIYEPGGLSGPKNNLRFAGLWLHHQEGSEAVRLFREQLVSTNTTAVITGAFVSLFYPTDEPAPGYAHAISGLEAHAEHFNSAMILTENQVAWRHKNMLVAGVERIPFAETFPFLNQLALDLGGIVGSLGSAEIPESIEVAGTRCGVQICYDSAFGWLSADLARDGAEVLLILTNDSWWGNTPGYRQLLSFAQLRAIETGRPVVRSANNGISAFISPDGRIQQQLEWNHEGAITAEVTGSNELTFYVRHGDFIYRWSAFTLPLLFVLGLIWKWRSQRT